MVKDALSGWRAATKEMGVPLHCHYSGVWDNAAGKKHPDWQRVDKDGKFVAGRMCVRGPYVDKLMIPQLIELIDRYEVDGFWIDGDIWATGPCWCDRCKAEFTKRTGIAEPPKETTDPAWPAWIGFTLDSYNEYAAKYVDAVHAHKPLYAHLRELDADHPQPGQAGGRHRLDIGRHASLARLRPSAVRGALPVDARQAVGPHDLELLPLRRRGAVRRRRG